MCFISINDWERHPSLQSAYFFTAKKNLKNPTWWVDTVMESSIHWSGHNDFLVFHLPVTSIPPTNQDDRVTHPPAAGPTGVHLCQTKSLAHPLPSLSTPWSILPLPINASTNHFIFSFSFSRTLSSDSRYGHRTRTSQGVRKEPAVTIKCDLLPRCSPTKEKVSTK